MYPHIGRYHFTSFCQSCLSHSTHRIVLAFLGGLVFAGSARLGFTVIAGLFFAGLATLILAGPTGLGCAALTEQVLVLAETCCSACGWRSISSSCGSLTSAVLQWLFPLCTGCGVGLPASPPRSFGKEAASQVVVPLTCSSSFSQIWCHLCLLQWPCQWPP